MWALTKRHLIPVLLATAFIFFAEESRGMSYISGYEYDQNQNYETFYEGYTDPSDTVSYNYPNPSLLHALSGYVDAATQTILAYAETTSNDDDWYQSGDMTIAKIDAEFSDTLTIGAGTSGLSSGDPVTLSLTLQLDGDMSTGTPCPMTPLCAIAIPGDTPVYQLASADVWASYDITDLGNVIIENEGTEEQTSYSPPLVDFSYGASDDFSAMDWIYVQTKYSSNYQWWIDLYDPDHDGLMYMENQVSWNIYADTGAQDDESYPDDEYYYSNYTECDFHACGGGSAIVPATYNYSVYDTGLISVDFTTYVGAELYITGDINLFLQAYGLNYPTGASANYLNTFSAGVTSPYVNGIELIYGSQNQSGTASVPEPSTLLLLGSGLAGLGLFGRKAFRKG